MTVTTVATWLQFASGVVAWDATVPLSGDTSVGFLDLMDSAEQVILDGAATNVELLSIEHDLSPGPPRLLTELELVAAVGVQTDPLPRCRPSPWLNCYAARRA